MPSSPRYRILLAPALACIADVTMTLLGQPAAYWAGDRSHATDFNRVARVLLELHPAAFPLAALAGLTLLSVVWVVGWPNPRLAYAMAFVVAFAQSVAAAGWLVRGGLFGCLAAVALLVIVERLLAYAEPRARVTPGSASPRARARPSAGNGGPGT